MFVIMNTDVNVTVERIMYFSKIDTWRTEHGAFRNNTQDHPN